MQQKIDGKKMLFSRDAIVAELAKWAIRQSLYPVPDNLEIACKKLYGLLPDTGENLGYFFSTGDEIKGLLRETIAKVPEIEAWNIPKIDLDALLRNVVRELVAEAWTDAED